ncbi:MAG TPA: nucleoside-diphosphate kinase [Solirubrobacteraceae bacterium]
MQRTLILVKPDAFARRLTGEIIARFERKGLTLVAMVLEGESAVVAARQVIGATNPLEATTGSIRGDYAIAVGQNLVHGSDAPESAVREVSLFFPELGLGPD